VFSDEKPIKKYEDFVDYLDAKIPERIGVTELDIKGENKVVYLRPNSLNRWW